MLLQLKRDWPAGSVITILKFEGQFWSPIRQLESNSRDSRRNPRSRSNTAHAFHDRYDEEPLPLPGARPSIRSNRATSSHQPPESPLQELPSQVFGSGRPDLTRCTTFEGPTQLRRDSSPSSLPRVSRVPSENINMRTQRSQLRPVARVTSGHEMFMDPSDDSAFNGSSSPDRSYDERSQRSTSPATSHGSAPSRNPSYSTLVSSVPDSKRQAPPPPPSRSKKPPPPPPPPPMKRSALSTMNTTYAWSQAF